MERDGVYQGLALLVSMIFAILGVIFLKPSLHEHRRTLAILFLVGVSARFFVSLAVYQFGMLSVIGDEDGMGWVFGRILYHDWISRDVSLMMLPVRLMDAFAAEQGRHLGYRYLLATVFYFTQAPERMVAAVVSCIAGALLPLIAFRVALKLFNPWVARFSAWAVCLTPSLILWSSLTVKEPIVILLEMIALSSCVRLRSRERVWESILTCTACLILLGAFRFYATVIVGAAIVSALLSAESLTTWRWGALAVLLCGVGGVLGGTGWLQRQTDYISSWDATRLRQYRDVVATNDPRTGGGGSGVRTTDDVTSPVGATRALAVGMAHLLLAPFPWNMGSGSTRMVGTLPEVVIWWFAFFVGFVPGLRFTIRNRLADLAPMLIMLLGFGLIYSIMFGNVGLVFRQRAQLLPWLLIITGVGIQRRLSGEEHREKPRRTRWIMRRREDYDGYPAQGDTRYADSPTEQPERARFDTTHSDGTPPPEQPTQQHPNQSADPSQPTWLSTTSPVERAS